MKAKFLKQDNEDTIQSYMMVNGARAVFATFEEYHPNLHDGKLFGGYTGPAQWNFAKPHLDSLTTSKPDETFSHFHVGFQQVEGFPEDENGRHERVFVFLGAVVINLASDRWGADELSDCSLFDVIGDTGAAPVGFTNRLEHTRSSKITYSARFRSHRGFITTLCNVFFPYAPTTFEDAAHIGISYGKYRPLGNLVAVDGTGTPGTKLVDSIYRLEPEVPTVQVETNGAVDLTFKAVWPESFDYDKLGGEIMDHPIEVYADTRAGYLPYRRSWTAEGKVTFTFMALGLKAGDRVKVKVGAGYMTKLGEAIVEVVGA